MSRAVQSAFGRHGPRQCLAQLKRVSLGTLGYGIRRSGIVRSRFAGTVVLVTLMLSGCASRPYTAVYTVPVSGVRVSDESCTPALGVDEASAVAADFGLEPGVEPWWFELSMREGRCAWGVTTALERTHSGGHLRTIYIDAQTGEVFDEGGAVIHGRPTVPESGAEVPNRRLQLSGLSVTPAAFAPVAPD